MNKLAHINLQRSKALNPTKRLCKISQTGKSRLGSARPKEGKRKGENRLDFSEIHDKVRIHSKNLTSLETSSGRDGLMLILKQAPKRLQTPVRMDSYLLALAAAAVSVPFGILSAEVLQTWLGGQSWMAGLVLGSSLFTYTILLVQMMKRQPPLFIKRLFPRKDLYCPRTINEISGLRLDYIGAKDPCDTVDGVVHNRAGELQRMIHCSLPNRFWFGGQSLMLEMLFADLASFKNARFQIVFPEADSGRRKDMIVIASHMMKNSGQQAGDDDKPPLEQMQAVLERLFERLITLGIAPRIMNANEVRQLISAELGSRANRYQLHRDWRNIGNLGWEPSFRDIVLKPTERFMQVADRHSYTIAVDQLPSTGSFEWLSAVLADIPFSHLSIFVSPWNASDPLSKLRMNHALKQQSASKVEQDNPTQIMAQMSFFIRFDGRDAYLLETEVSTAQRYFKSLGINAGNNHPAQYRQQQMQLQNWRSTLPCAQEYSQHKHVVAFVRGAQA